MTRRNPKTRTSGGTVRETRSSTLVRRPRGVIRVDMTSMDDGLATIMYTMRNGDEVEQIAPNVLIALDAISYSSDRFFQRLRDQRPVVYVNGVEADEEGLRREARRAYGVYTMEFLGATAEARYAWEELGERFAQVVATAWDAMLRRRYEPRNVLGGVVSKRAAIFMASMATAMGAARVDSLGSPYDESDADTLYVDLRSDRRPTVMVQESLGYRYISVAKRIDEYEPPEPYDDEA